MRLLIILILLSSCSSSWHLRQANKHILKAQQKGAIIKHDTVFVDVITERTITDTVVQIKDNFLSDTITIETIKWKSRTKIDTVHKKVYQQVECKPDTIRVPVTVKTEIKAKAWPWWYLLIAGLAGIGIGVLLFVIRK